MKHLYFQAAHTLFRCIALVVLCLLFAISETKAQCPNADFETGTFANWQGRIGSCCPINTPTNGIVAGRHTIMTGPGTDPNTCNNVPVVAPGSNFSARLGNDNTNSEAERLLYTFNVTPQSNLIIYKYAVVLENPSAHSISEQPRFEVRVRDANNNVIPCTYYQVAASSNIPGFQNCNGVVYKNWTTVGVDVSAYIGQTVTLDFATGDCDLGAHFGYAYIDASCSPLQIDARYCLGSNQAQLDAPAGFASYQWSTGQTTPSITINNPTQGQVVSCVITSVTGCQATLYATLNPTNPNPSFTVINNCMGQASFNNTSTVVNGTVGGYVWNFGDGTTDTTTNPTHAYAAPGQYNVSLTVTSDLGCSDVIIQPVTIYPTPTAGFNFNNACLGTAVNVTDQSVIQQGNINQWNWNFGDNSPAATTQNGSHIYADTGTYTIRLIVSQNGQCPDTLSQNVVVKANPIAAFTTTSVCNGLPSPFTNNSTTLWGNISWNWNMDENGVTSALQNPTYTYVNPGTFNPTLIVTQSNATHTCSDTISVPVNIYAVPVAAFTSDQYLCLGEQTVFTNQSTVVPNEPLIYAWNFGDNSTDATANPTHTYAAYGNYTTQLIVSTANACADTISAIQNIYPIPVAGVTPDVTSGCETLTVNYQGQSTVATGNILSWTWDLGDGTTSNTQNPTVNYNNGTYNVTLIVEAGDANNSCFDTAQFVIKSFAVPVAAFTSDQYLCLGEETVFTNTSNVSTNENLNYTWDFGDNTATSTLTSPSHTYAAFGTYTAQLIVTTDNSCADTVSAPQNIYAVPVAGIVPDATEGCEPLTINFTGVGNVAQGVITAYNWDLGNGSTSALQNPTTTYNTANTYNVTLIVEAGDVNNYCYDTATTSITVHPLPVADFNTANACFGNQVVFNNLSTVASGFIQTYAWDFGDNTGTSTQQNPGYLYGTEGQYTVSLNITTDQGCQDSITRILDIYPPPVVDFTSDINAGCSPLTISFQDLTTVSNGNIATWLWDFGDNTSTSSDQNPIHTYTNPGTYTVTLTVTTNFGCTDVFTFTNMITVYPNPVAAFTAQPNPTTEMDPYILITDLSAGASVYQWNLGNGDTTSQQNPRVMYDSWGNYTIQLYVENQYGCWDTTSQTIIITPTYTFYVPNAFTPNNDGVNDMFFGAGTNIKTYEMYIFNRWGEMIFKSFNMDNKWDGRLGKERVQDEVYVYMFIITDIFDQQHTYRGSVTMIR